MSSSGKSIWIDLQFSSKCFKDDVPGIGKINGERFNNQARLICDSV